MSSLNINYNGNSIPIADIGIVSSKEKVQLGNLERDLVIQTLGSISIQVGNKFYDLNFESSGNNASITSNINYITSLLSFDISRYNDGDFIFDKSTESLYLVYNKTLKQIVGEDSSNKIFLSFVDDQILNGEQKQRLVLNTGYYIKTLDDVRNFNKNDVFENQIIFIEDEKKHYILSDFNNPNIVSSWEPIYISSNGGTINNGLIIKNKTRDNLLYLNGVDDLNGEFFNGLKIGDSDIWIKQSVNTNNQAIIDYNSKEFIIKNQSNVILRTSGDNIGIGGDPSNSDKYKITLNGTAKFEAPIYTDSKIVSTDYTSTNITHWDGGKGFGLTRGNDGKWFFEADDVLVRGSLIANKMILKELEVERAYATGGHMLITDGANINSHVYRKPTEYEWKYANTVGEFTISTTTVDGGTITNTYTGLGGNYGTLDANTFYYFITFKESTEKDDNNSYVSLPSDVNPIATTTDNSSSIEQDTLDVDKNCPFICGDVLLCQTTSGLTAKKYYCLVSYSTNKYAVVKETDLRNNNIYQRDNEGNIVDIYKDFGIETGDTLIRVTNILAKNGQYLYPERRRFIDVDGTRNQITMYDNMGKPDSFSGSLIDGKYYSDVNLITGITQDNGAGGTEQGALRLRMGRLDDLGIQGLGGYGLYADNVYLKGKLIVKNGDIEEFVGANRGTWVLNNLNSYYVNDLVTYNGSVYRCTTNHTNTLESSAIPGISSFWEIWVQKGSDGVAGTSFKYVDISGEQVFVYDQELNSFDKQNIPLTCTAFNIDYTNLINIKFEWKIGDTIIYSKTYLKSDVLSGTISDSINVYPRDINESINWDNFWSTNKSISIKCLVYINNSGTYDSDVFSLYKVENGKDGINGNDAYTIILSNESMSIPALNNGMFPSNVFEVQTFETGITVYKGSTKLTYGAITGDSYSISVIPGSRFTMSEPYVDINSNPFIKINDISQDVNNGIYIPDSMSVNLLINIIKNNVNTGTSFIKTLSVSKAKVGPEGPMLDWISDWDGNSVMISGNKIVSPRIFSGGYVSPTDYTGVSIGRNAFGITENGIAGYYHAKNTFYLNAGDGSFRFGTDNSTIQYQPSTGQILFGSDVSLNWLSPIATAKSEAIETSGIDSTNKVNSIKIGGVNIMSYTKDIQTFVSKYGYGSSDYGNNTYIIENDYYKNTVTANGNANNYHFIGTGLPDLLIGQYYTLSMDVKTNSNNGSLGFMLNYPNEGQSLIPIPNTNGIWNRISITALINNPLTSQSLFDIRFTPGVLGDYVCYKNIKMETGNKATDWSISPNDLNSYIQGKTDLAQSDAESNAAIDATNKVKALSDAHNGFTYIDSNGIYTGSLTANQINAVAINASSITTGTLSVDRLDIDNLFVKRISSTNDPYKFRLAIVNNGIGFFKSENEENQGSLSGGKSLISIGKGIGYMVQDGDISPGIVVTDNDWLGEYSSTKIYYKDDRVYFSPPSSNIYDLEVQYNLGDIVQYDNYSWKCIMSPPNSGYQPYDGSLYWLKYYNTYKFTHEWSDSLNNPAISGIPPESSEYPNYWVYLQYGIQQDKNYTSQLTSSGIFSNGSNTLFYSFETRISTNSSGSFLLFKRNDDSDGISAAVAGIDLTSDSDGVSSSYGGYFTRLRANGFYPNTIRISNSYSVTKLDCRIHTYNTSGTITITLPYVTDRDIGLTLYLRRLAAGNVTVQSTSSQSIWSTSSYTSYALGLGGQDILTWDGLHWVKNYFNA